MADSSSVAAATAAAAPAPAPSAVAVDTTVAVVQQEETLSTAAMAAPAALSMTDRSPAVAGAADGDSSPVPAPAPHPAVAPPSPHRSVSFAKEATVAGSGGGGGGGGGTRHPTKKGEVPKNQKKEDNVDTNDDEDEIDNIDNDDNDKNDVDENDEDNEEEDQSSSSSRQSQQKNSSMDDAEYLRMLQQLAAAGGTSGNNGGSGSGNGDDSTNSAAAAAAFGSGLGGIGRVGNFLDDHHSVLGGVGGDGGSSLAGIQQLLDDDNMDDDLDDLDFQLSDVENDDDDDDDDFEFVLEGMHHVVNAAAGGAASGGVEGSPNHDASHSIGPLEGLQHNDTMNRPGAGKKGDNDDGDADDNVSFFIGDLEAELGDLLNEDLDAAIYSLTRDSMGQPGTAGTGAAAPADGGGMAVANTVDRAAQLFGTAAAAAVTAAGTNLVLASTTGSMYNHNNNTHNNHPVVTAATLAVAAAAAERQKAQQKLAATTDASAAASSSPGGTTNTTTTTEQPNAPNQQQQQQTQHPVITPEQDQQFQQLLQSHYQLLVQQAVLSVRASAMVSQQHQQPQPSTTTKKNNDNAAFFGGLTPTQGGYNNGNSSGEELALRLDAAVQMMQDLDQHRQDAIRTSLQWEDTTSALSSLVAAAATGTFHHRSKPYAKHQDNKQRQQCQADTDGYDDDENESTTRAVGRRSLFRDPHRAKHATGGGQEVEEQDGQYHHHQQHDQLQHQHQHYHLFDDHDDNEDRALVVRRRLTRAAFQKLQAQQPGAGSKRRTVFDVPGLLNLKQLFTTLDEGRNYGKPAPLSATASSPTPKSSSVAKGVASTKSTTTKSAKGTVAAAKPTAEKETSGTPTTSNTSSKDNDGGLALPKSVGTGSSGESKAADSGTTTTAATAAASASTQKVSKRSSIICDAATHADACREVLRVSGARCQNDLLPDREGSDLSENFASIEEVLGIDDDNDSGGGDGNGFQPPLSDEQKSYIRRNRNLFTAGEDNLLMKGVNLYGEKQWMLISDRYLPDRSVNIISQRYSKLCLMIYKAHGVQIGKNGGFATPPKLVSVDEIDETKLKALDLRKIEMPQVLNVHRWSLEEDLTLLKAVPIMGNMWAELSARYMPHRDRGHLRKRYQVLERRVKATVVRVAKDQKVKAAAMNKNTGVQEKKGDPKTASPKKPIAQIQVDANSVKLPMAPKEGVKVVKVTGAPASGSASKTNPLPASASSQGPRTATANGPKKGPFIVKKRPQSSAKNPPKPTAVRKAVPVILPTTAEEYLSKNPLPAPKAKIKDASTWLKAGTLPRPKGTTKARTKRSTKSTVAKKRKSPGKDPNADVMSVETAAASLAFMNKDQRTKTTVTTGTVPQMENTTGGSARSHHGHPPTPPGFNSHPTGYGCLPPVFPPVMHHHQGPNASHPPDPGQNAPKPAITRATPTKQPDEPVATSTTQKGPMKVRKKARAGETTRTAASTATGATASAAAKTDTLDPMTTAAGFRGDESTLGSGDADASRLALLRLINETGDEWSQMSRIKAIMDQDTDSNGNSILATSKFAIDQHVNGDITGLSFLTEATNHVTGEEGEHFHDNGGATDGTGAKDESDGTKKRKAGLFSRVVANASSTGARKRKAPGATAESTHGDRTATTTTQHRFRKLSGMRDDEEEEKKDAATPTKKTAPPPSAEPSFDTPNKNLRGSFYSTTGTPLNDGFASPRAGFQSSPGTAAASTPQGGFSPVNNSLLMRNLMQEGMDGNTNGSWIGDKTNELSLLPLAEASRQQERMISNADDVQRALAAAGASSHLPSSPDKNSFLMGSAASMATADDLDVISALDFLRNSPYRKSTQRSPGEASLQTTKMDDATASDVGANAGSGVVGGGGTSLFAKVMGNAHTKGAAKKKKSTRTSPRRNANVTKKRLKF